MRYALKRVRACQFVGSKSMRGPDDRAALSCSKDATMPSHAPFSTLVSWRPWRYISSCSGADDASDSRGGPIPKVGGTKPGGGAVIEEGDIFSWRRWYRAFFRLYWIESRVEKYWFARSTNNSALSSPVATASLELRAPGIGAGESSLVSDSSATSPGRGMASSFIADDASWSKVAISNSTCPKALICLAVELEFHKSSELSESEFMTGFEETPSMAGLVVQNLSVSVLRPSWDGWIGRAHV